jgi:hypothetical protein
MFDVVSSWNEVVLELWSCSVYGLSQGSVSFLSLATLAPLSTLHSNLSFSLSSPALHTNNV